MFSGEMSLSVASIMEKPEHKLNWDGSRMSNKKITVFLSAIQSLEKSRKLHISQENGMQNNRFKIMSVIHNGFQSNGDLQKGLP